MIKYTPSFFLSLVIIFFMGFQLVLPLSIFAQQGEINKEVAERYEQLFLRNPDKGMAFDRVYEWYASEGGGLELLVEKWKKQSEQAEISNDEKSALLTVRAILAEKMRDTDTARRLYNEAIQTNDAAANAARLLAGMEAFEGNFDAAAAAYQKALEASDLSPPDRIDLMRSLARVYQRAYKLDEAIRVWQNAVERYPEDSNVLEQAGEAFLENDQFELARNTFLKLNKISTNDPYKRVSSMMLLARACDLEGDRKKASEIYSQLLDDTSDGSWLNRELRLRIDDLFRRADDLPGLEEFYSKRLESHTDDFRSLLAKSDILLELGRMDECISTLKEAARLAPENEDVQMQLAKSLADAGKVDEAIKVAEKLSLNSDSSQEAYLLVGDLWWKKFEIGGEASAEKQAIECYARIAPEGSNDPASIARLAEAYSSRGLDALALEQWKRLLALSPEAHDARQKIAKHLLKEGKPEEANTLLEEIIVTGDGNEVKAENYIVLARLQSALDMPEKSAETLAVGAVKFPNNYDLLSRYWNVLVENKDYDKGLAVFPQMWRCAPNEYFANDAVRKYLSMLESSKKSETILEDLRQRINAGDNLEDYERIVLFRMAQGADDEVLARKVLDTIIASDGDDVVLRFKSDFAETFLSAEEQIAVLRELLKAQPQFALETLRRIADVQVSGGKMEDAKASFEEIIQRAPGDVSSYRLLSDHALRMGDYDFAVQTLKSGLPFV
ncbi:MAG: tetratricopeptide repeat protein, partial [Chthoniobacterales bacterium]